MTSELAGHKVDQTKWLEQLIDLARQTGNDYYHSLGLLAMGKRVYGEGDKQLGIEYASDAIDLMAKTDREDTDHLTHSQMIILAGLYGDMKDYENALKTDERNVLLTQKGTRWGEWPQQAIDQRMALAKMALTLARMGNFRRADSAYDAWKAVEYEGNPPATILSSIICESAVAIRRPYPSTMPSSRGSVPRETRWAR